MAEVMVWFTLIIRPATTSAQSHHHITRPTAAFYLRVHGFMNLYFSVFYDDAYADWGYKWPQRVWGRQAGRQAGKQAGRQAPSREKKHYYLFSVTGGFHGGARSLTRPCLPIKHK